MLDLTPRQRECVALLVTGKSDKEIAACLGVSENTVSKHLTDAAWRAGMPNLNRVELAVWWTRREAWLHLGATA